MTEADFLDYEPSRLRLIDLSEATRKLALQADPLITMPRKRRPRPLGHAARRLKDGHGIGMVMLCTLGQIWSA